WALSNGATLRNLLGTTVDDLEVVLDGLCHRGSLLGWARPRGPRARTDGSGTAGLGREERTGDLEDRRLARGPLERGGEGDAAGDQVEVRGVAGLDRGDRGGGGHEVGAPEVPDGPGVGHDAGVLEGPGRRQELFGVAAVAEVVGGFRDRGAAEGVD